MYLKVQYAVYHNKFAFFFGVCVDSTRETFNGVFERKFNEKLQRLKQSGMPFAYFLYINNDLNF